MPWPGLLRIVTSSTQARMMARPRPDSGSSAMARSLASRRDLVMRLRRVVGVVGSGVRRCGLIALVTPQHAHRPDGPPQARAVPPADLGGIEAATAVEHLKHASLGADVCDKLVPATRPRVPQHIRARFSDR